MNENINLNINMNSKEVAMKALAVVKTVTTNQIRYKGWENFWNSQLVVKDTTITFAENLDYYSEYGVLAYQFMELMVPAICKKLSEEMPETDFEGFALYEDYRCCYSADYDFAFKNGKLKFQKTETEETFDENEEQTSTIKMTGTQEHNAIINT